MPCPIGRSQWQHNWSTPRVNPYIRHEKSLVEDVNRSRFDTAPGLVFQSVPAPEPVDPLRTDHRQGGGDHDGRQGQSTMHGFPRQFGSSNWPWPSQGCRGHQGKATAQRSRPSKAPRRRSRRDFSWSMPTSRLLHVLPRAMSGHLKSLPCAHHHARLQNNSLTRIQE